MQALSKYIYFVVCFVLFLFSDLKVSNYLATHHRALDIHNSVFSITYVKNTGAAFNLLNNSTELLIILSVVVLTLIFLYVIKHVKETRMLELFFIAVLSAGIAGNMHERIIYGFVRDFFQLKTINFPVFNISDILINIGVIVLVVMILIKKTR